MQKLKRQSAKEAVELIKATPMPTHDDINRAKAAAIYCKSITEFSDALGVDPLVIKLWCSKSPSFNTAYRSWKEHATSNIERALAKRATGFTKRTIKQVLTRQGTVEELVTEEYFAPDVSAISFWLKNRAPTEWKDKSEVDINVAANIRAWMVAAADGATDSVETVDAEFVAIEDSRSAQAASEPEIAEASSEAEAPAADAAPILPLRNKSALNPTDLFGQADGGKLLL